MFVGAGSSGANLIVNGGFEMGDLTGWDSTCNVNVQSSDALGNIKPYEGQYMAVLGTYVGALNAELSQTFVNDGRGFNLSFAWTMQALDVWQWRDLGIDQITGSLTATMGGQELFSDSLTINDPWGGGTSYLPWHEVSKYIDTGITGDIALTFNLNNFGDALQLAGAYVDDVSVHPVPEPGAIFISGLGLAGLAVVGRKRLRGRTKSRQV
jgi:hypothetical protein